MGFRERFRKLSIKLSTIPGFKGKQEKLSPRGSFEGEGVHINRDGFTLLDHERPVMQLKDMDNDSVFNYEPGQEPLPVVSVEPIIIQMSDYSVTLKPHDLKFVKSLGEGRTGVVSLLRYLDSDLLLAVKSVRFPLDDDAEMKQLAEELKILRKCDCLNIVKFYGAYLDEQQILHIVMEYATYGTLSDMLAPLQSLNEEFIALIAKQALNGLAYLHEKMHIVHRDLKPTNILVFKNGFIKIADFGVSRMLPYPTLRADTFVGTITYMSPERIRGEPYTLSSDIWSLGIILLECALGRYPYSEKAGRPSLSPLSVHQMIINEISPDADLPNASKEFSDFLHKCLAKEPSNRSTSRELLQHAFVQKAASEVSFVSYLEMRSSENMAMSS